MIRTEPTAEEYRGGLLTAVDEQVRCFERGQIAAAELRSWMLHRSLGSARTLRELAGALDTEQVKARMSPNGWFTIRATVDELLEEFASAEPGAPTIESAQKIRAPTSSPQAGGSQPDFPKYVSGRYRLVEAVHDAVGSRVFRGVDEQPEDLRGESVVAIKLLAAEWIPAAAHPDAERLRALTGRHTGLARVLAAGIDGCWAYQVMEWVSGETVEQCLARQFQRSSELPGAPIWLRQLGESLDAMHAAGFVHGDVSPANVIVTPQGDTKLIDLTGLRAGAERVPGGQGMTRAFASPEALLGAPADRRDDVYGLAALAYRILAGHLPNARDGSVSDGHPLPPPAMPPHITHEQSQALSAGLCPARDWRIASASQFVASLLAEPEVAWPAMARYAEADDVTAGSLRGAEFAARRLAVDGRVERPNRRHRRAAAGLGLLAAAGVVAWALMPDVQQWVGFEPPDGSILQDWLTLVGFGTSSGTGTPDMLPEPAAKPTVAVTATEPAASAPPAEPPTTEIEQDPVQQAPAVVVLEQPLRTRELSPSDMESASGQPIEPTGAEADLAQRPVAPAPSPIRYSFPNAQQRVSHSEPAILLPVLRQGLLDAAAELRFVVLPGSARPDQDYMPSQDSGVHFGVGEDRALIVLPLVRAGEPSVERMLRIRLLVEDPATAGEVMETQIVLAGSD